jgi:TIR domain-containing protein
MQSHRAGVRRRETGGFVDAFDDSGEPGGRSCTGVVVPLLSRETGAAPFHAGLPLAVPGRILVLREGCEWVADFAKSLQDQDVKFWVDRSSVAAGESWEDEIHNALRNSEFFVVIVSPHTLNSEWIYFELGAALASKKTIITVVMASEGIPLPLRSFQVLRESSPLAAGKRVAEVIHARRSEASTSG